LDIQEDLEEFTKIREEKNMGKTIEKLATIEKRVLDQDDLLQLTEHKANRQKHTD
jgi:hypothetical protein